MRASAEDKLSHLWSRRGHRWRSLCACAWLRPPGGTHADPLEQNGLYARLYTRNFEDLGEPAPAVEIERGIRQIERTPFP